ncbi:helix-turn-helix transcriptional regulator [Microbacterium awajiense]
MDRDYAEPLDVPTMAARALMSPAHFSREFKVAYGETPYAYLVTRRVERAMALLRAGSTVTDACTAVGATSLGSFSSAFRRLVGESPSAYRLRPHSAAEAMPPCIAKVLTRPTRYAPPVPSRIGEDAVSARA